MISADGAAIGSRAGTVLIALRDLQHRRRRFAVSIVAVGVVFGIALLLSGLSTAFGNEAERVVRGFEADRWAIGEGTTGPFTSTKLLPTSVADELGELPGVTAVSPLLVSTGAVDGMNVNLLGIDVDAGFGPSLSAGRLPTAGFEVVADESLGAELGGRFDLGGRSWTVVGTTEGQRYLAGVPVVFARYDDVREVQIDGVAAASSFMIRGVPTDPLPATIRLVDDAAAIDDLGRPLVSAVQTIDAVRVLLWLVAAGIIGSIMYLSVLERTRDIAVLKAIGSSNRSILAGLLAQAVIVALVATVIALLVAVALGPSFPMAVEIPGSALIALPLVALAIAGLASLVGIRRAVRVDPALAFGG